MPRNALGRGLSALIREPEPQTHHSQTQPPPLQPQVPASPANHPSYPSQPPSSPSSSTSNLYQQPQSTSLPPHQNNPSTNPSLHSPSPFSSTTSQAAATATALAPVPNELFLHVDIDLIEPSPYQPRTRFREEALEELAQSIRSSGIVQPLVVRRSASRYQLIAGERRWRAAQRAELHSIPVVVRDVPEGMAMEMTLVENLQREDLNPIEQAHAFQRLTDEFHLTQEQVAERTGKDRTTIANAVRLLKLEASIQDLVEEGKVTAGHARALLAVTDQAQRLDLAKKIARGGMTVRQVERLATRVPRPREHSAAYAPDPNTKAALEDLQREYSARALIHPKAGSKGGELAFEYFDDADLARLYDHLMRK